MEQFFYRLVAMTVLLLLFLDISSSANEKLDKVKNKTKEPKEELDNKYIINHASAQWQIQCGKLNWSISDGCNISGLLHSLLLDYDKRLRPLMDKQTPVTVIVGFWILSIDSINVIDMDYQIDFFFRQSWQDPRLEHSYPQTLTVSNSMLEKIWVPDTYFENSKNSHFHAVTVPNKMLKIKPDGTIMYNARISVRASCPMDLRMFPMDIQECNLNIESYGYSTRDIKFEWEKSDSKISIGTKVRTLPQYNLTGFKTTSKETVYVVGNWSGLTATFVLERRTGYFFLHLYAPCALIVMISWISFCIPKDSTAARVALGITSVLTITTILNMLNTAMPKVSYIKAVDWYLIVSFLFVFAVLIEYTLVLYLTDKEKQTRNQKLEQLKKSRLRNEGKTPAVANGHTANGKATEVRSRAYHNNQKETSFDCSDIDKHSYPSKPLIVVLEGKHFPHNRHADVDEDHSMSLKTNVGRFLCQFRVDIIDEYSRMIFPIAFATFNTVYWLLFFSKKSSSNPG